MKRSLRSVLIMLAGILLLSGCTAFEPQHKTETEVINITDGMFPQVIEKDVTYVQNEKDGAWTEESSEMTKWDITPGFDISDSVWAVTTSDVSTLVTFLDDSYKGVSATLYIHFSPDSTDIQTTANGDSSLDITLNTTGDFVFTSNGSKFNFNDVAISKAGVKPDGAVTLGVDLGNGMAGDIEVPASVKKCEWTDFLIAQSDTYIKTVPFEDLPEINVSSSTLANGIWDPKISNTEVGENISPELTWDAVDGATQYVVIMIDDAWLHMDVFTTETSLAEGAVERGARGEQYVGPYPPKGTTHTYTVFVFALKDEMSKVPLAFDGGGNSISKIFDGLDVDVNGNSGNFLAYGRLDGNFTRK